MAKYLKSFIRGHFVEVVILPVIIVSRKKLCVFVVFQKIYIASLK